MVELPMVETPGTAIDPVCGMTVATVETSLHLDHEAAHHGGLHDAVRLAAGADGAGPSAAARPSGRRRTD